MRRAALPVLVLLAAAPLRAAEETALTVTVKALGAEAARESVADGVGAFVSRLDGRAGLAAEAAKGATEKWDLCPPGLAPERRISLVSVCIGARTDWLAFAFDAEGRPVGAARRPARQWDTAGIYPYNIPPGDRQIDRNAGIELASDVGHGLAAWKVRRERPRLEWLPAATGESELPMTPAETEGLRALAWAALLRAVPRADGVWTLKAGKAEAGYDLVLSAPAGGSHSRRAPKEAVYPVLVRMVRALEGWGGTLKVSDFPLVDQGGARLLGWNGERAFFELGDSMTCVSPVDGLVEWTASIEARYKPAYTWGPWSAAGDPARSGPHSFHPSVAPVRNGVVARGPGANESLPWGFDALPDGGYVVAQDRTVMATDPKTYRARWEWGGADRMAAGPLIAGDRVLAGGLAGELVALGLKDGRLLWRADAGCGLSGPMTALPGGRAAAPSPEGALVAFDVADGRIAWRVELGDTVLGRSVPVPAGLLAASRSGRVCLIDPEKGTVKAVWEAGAQAAGCAVAGGKVGWAGRDGRVVWLALPGLTPAAEGRLGARLADGLAGAENMPLHWGTGNDLGLRGPAALAVDEEGFAYVLPVP